MTKTFKNKLSCFLCLLITLFSVSSVYLFSKNLKPQQVVYASSNEFRSAWVSTVWNLDFPQTNGKASEFKTQYNKVLDSFDKMNMNVVTFQIRPRGDAFYPSNLNPWSHRLTGTQGKAPEAGFDPLSYMVSETHKRGMKYYAWFNPYLITESTYTGKTKEQILSTLSSNNFARKNPDLVFLDSGKLYLNPGEPKVQQFIINTVMEVVNKYDIDGVQFDDYFYPYGASFKQTNPDMATYKKYGSGFSSIESWRRNNTDTLIKNLNAEIKKSKSNVKFGISPFGIWGNSAKHPSGSSEGEGAAVSKTSMSSYDDIFADTRKWVKQGWIDYIIPQLYWSCDNNVAPYKVLVDWWANVVKGTNCNLYIGHAVYKYKDGQANSYEAAHWKNPSEILNQIEYNRKNPNVKGSSFFSLRDLNSNVANFKTNLVSKFYTSKTSDSEVETTPEYTISNLNFYKLGLGNRLVWTDNDKTCVNYKIYRSTSLIDPESTLDKDLITTFKRKNNSTYLSYKDNSVDLKKTYYYLVEGIDSNGKVIKKFIKK